MAGRVVIRDATAGLRRQWTQRTLDAEYPLRTTLQCQQWRAAATITLAWQVEAAQIAG